MAANSASRAGDNAAEPLPVAEVLGEDAFGAIDVVPATGFCNVVVEGAPELP